MSASPPLLPFDLAMRRLLVQSSSDLTHAAAGANEQPAPSLVTLADTLSVELEPLLTGPIPIPEHKARLTRGGGRCPEHGTLLRFDPWSAHAHRCERCDAVYRGRDHDDWWAMGAQLWTVERAVHAAALFLLRGRAAHADVALRILDTVAQRYVTWPNRDNVLGPSRPFFSTYLESIWLLNICHALSLLEQAVAPGIEMLGGQLRDALVAPSAALIEGFPEGLSNRQVWNEVALLSARHVLGDAPAVQRRLAMRGGLPWILERGLLNDGSWYEGENYHLFAHRGLWYGVQLMAALRQPLSMPLVARYREGFVTPLLGLLPDDTLPSRRDSQYAISVRQWRVAEWLELGYAESADPRIAAMLTRLYDQRGARRDTGRWCSTADAERNAPATTLTRADLSWRGLLMANPSPPPLTQWSPTSGLLASQGLSVLRRDSGRTYIALEGGHSGGGHGHPDALALTLQSGAARWLEDPGTGSYTERVLHWYRSTLAHAAPLVDRQSTRAASVELLAFEEEDGAGWIRKRAHNPITGVTFERTIVALEHYLVDLLDWSAGEVREITLPIAGDALLEGDAPWTAYEQRGAGGLEDGFDFVDEAEAIPLPPLLSVYASATRADPSGARAAEVARAWYASSSEGVLVRAKVPGPPGHPRVVRHWVQVRAARGRIIGVWNWPSSAGAMQSVQLDPRAMPCATILDDAGTTTAHSAMADRWEVDIFSASTCRRITLSPMTPAERIPSSVEPAETAAEERRMVVPLVDNRVLAHPPGVLIPGAACLVLGQAHYVPTEQPWADAGAPTASVQLVATDTDFVVDIDMCTGPLVVNPAGLENPLDNERADVNSDGVQWYLGVDTHRQWTSAGLVVPETPATARASVLVPGLMSKPLVSWRVTPAGWAMRLRWPRAHVPLDSRQSFRFDLIVNERSPDRERRRGQLVLSGGGGFGYLRGDRHGTTHALSLSFS